VTQAAPDLVVNPDLRVHEDYRVRGEVLVVPVTLARPGLEDPQGSLVVVDSLELLVHRV